MSLSSSRVIDIKEAFSISFSAIFFLFSGNSLNNFFNLFVLTLDELKDDIKLYGVKETYVNGKDQFGFKESIESKTYNTMVKNYMNIIKQLM